MGEPKGLVEVDGVPWLERQIEALRACGVAYAIVVLGHARDRYVARLPWLEHPDVVAPWRDFRLDVVVNPAPERGPFSSLVTGCMRRRGAAAFVLPVDVPCADRAVWTSLGAALVAGVDACVPVHGGRGGHPVLGSAHFLDSLEAVPTDAPAARLDEQLRSAGSVVRVEVADARIGLNLNTPSDWDSIRR
jgi:CTP:molybdopterin cytidylyltransferase MocA